MAGGAANIWGNLVPDATPGGGSRSYQHPEWIETNSRFFEKRFVKDMVRDNTITDGVCLRRPAGGHYVFYREDASSVRMDLSGMDGPQPAVAVDAKQDYAEIDLGTLDPTDQTWPAPYESDWAVAVGTFAGRARDTTAGKGGGRGCAPGAAGPEGGGLAAAVLAVLLSRFFFGFLGDRRGESWRGTG